MPTESHELEKCKLMKNCGTIRAAASPTLRRQPVSLRPRPDGLARNLNLCIQSAPPQLFIRHGVVVREAGWAEPAWAARGPRVGEAAARMVAHLSSSLHLSCSWLSAIREEVH